MLPAQVDRAFTLDTLRGSPASTSTATGTPTGSPPPGSRNGQDRPASVQVDGSGPPYQDSMMCRAIDTGGGSIISRDLIAASSPSRLNPYASASSSWSTVMAC